MAAATLVIRAVPALSDANGSISPRRRQLEGRMHRRQRELDSREAWYAVHARNRTHGTTAVLSCSRAVRLQHVDTGMWLYTSKNDRFNQNNCRNCPIIGQLEVSAHSAGASDANSHVSSPRSNDATR